MVAQVTGMPHMQSNRKTALVALHSDFDELGSDYLFDFLGSTPFPN
jgi:hypothetical protein